jgi:hypothetical protein
MASSSETLFEENKISPAVLAADSLRFFQDHGVFYQANAAIGKLVEELDSQGLAWKSNILSRYLPILIKDPVCQLSWVVRMAAYVH